MCYKGRCLCIKCAIPFNLIRITSCMSVKEITVMNPYMIIILLKSYIVALTTVDVHNSKIADLNIRRTLNSDTPAISCCIFTDTFNSKTCKYAIYKKITLVKYSRICNIADYTDIKRCCISLCLLICCKNILYT